MYQGKAYKKGELLGAISAVLSFGIGLYIILSDESFKYLDSFSKFVNISTMICLAFTAVFAFSKLSKISVLFIAIMYTITSVHYIKYFETYNSMVKVAFNGTDNGYYSVKIPATQTINYLCNGLVQYFVYLIALLTIILFIVDFVIPDRRGLATAVIILSVIIGLMIIAADIASISEVLRRNIKMQTKEWVIVSLHVVKAFFDILMVSNIANSVKIDAPAAGSGSVRSTGGMYGIPFVNAPANNPPYQRGGYEGTFMNQSNAFSQPNNGFGQPGNGYGMMNNTYGQPINGYGGMNNGFMPPNNGYGQMNSRFAPPNSGYGQMNSRFAPPNNGYGQMNNGYAQPNNSYNQMGDSQTQPNNSYGQMNTDQNGFGQMNNGSDRPVQKPADTAENKPADNPENIAEAVLSAVDVNESAAGDLSIYEKPDNM